MNHILSADQFTTKQLKEIYERADALRKSTELHPKKLATKHQGVVVATVFYEPSTRTRLSFESAAGRLGMHVISTENARESSSNTKGESLEDSVRTVAQFADILILRHSDNDSALRAAKVSSIPVINAGAGKNEHPTQALLDLYTIQHAKGRLNNLRVTVGGDLMHGRTARSLVNLLALFPDNVITFVSTPELKIDEDIKVYLDTHNVTYTETADIHPSLEKADVIYWTRLQKERLADSSLRSTFSISKEELSLVPHDAILMHPLPRNDEIAPDVDHDPRAIYFDQVKNGLYVRMALLDLIANTKQKPIS